MHAYLGCVPFIRDGHWYIELTATVSAEPQPNSLCLGACESLLDGLTMLQRYTKTIPTMAHEIARMIVVVKVHRSTYQADDAPTTIRVCTAIRLTDWCGKDKR